MFCLVGLSTLVSDKPQTSPETTYSGLTMDVSHATAQQCAISQRDWSFRGEDRDGESDRVKRAEEKMTTDSAIGESVMWSRHRQQSVV